MNQIKPDENVMPDERTKYLEIYDATDRTRIGHLASLDTTGAVAVGHRALDPGIEMAFRIAWNRGGGWTETAKVDGEVIRSREDLASDTYTIEIRFIEPSAEAIAEIQRILNREPGFSSPTGT